MKQLILLSFTFLYSIISFAQIDFQKKLQTDLIMIEDNQTITLPPGNYMINTTLSLDGKNNVSIIGAGMDKTILNFKGQKEGAEGLKITNAKGIKLEGFTVLEAKGDAIKTQNVDGISFIDVKTAWLGKPDKKNGAYGLYPVQCTNVLIDKCEAVGASDAGIYVGQSDHVIVRNSKAYRNVAGIEIENTTNADVYDNVAEENTGGILVFDLPGLIKKNGGNVRIFNNVVKNNNYKNFAPKGNIVGTVPPGTGVIVLATSNVEIFGNKITNHRTVSTTVVSYYLLQQPFNDEAYDPYPNNIYIHDNVFTNKKRRPSLSKKMGVLVWAKFKRDVPDIIIDGIFDKAHLDDDGQLKAGYKICVNNPDATFANLDAENDFENLTREVSGFQCEGTSFPTIELQAALNAAETNN